MTSNYSEIIKKLATKAVTTNGMRNVMFQIEDYINSSYSKNASTPVFGELEVFKEMPELKSLDLVGLKRDLLNLPRVSITSCQHLDYAFVSSLYVVVTKYTNEAFILDIKLNSHMFFGLALFFNGKYIKLDLEEPILQCLAKAGVKYVQK